MKLTDDEIEQKLVAAIEVLQELVEASGTPDYVRVNAARNLGKALAQYQEMFSRAEPEKSGLRSVRKDF